MAKQLLASLAHPVKVRLPRPVLAIGGVLFLALIIAGVWTVATPRPATCQAPCQCWYCPQYRYIGGEFFCDSPCDHGCAGACAYNDDYPQLGSCSQVPGQGGCGPVCSCRDSDCVGGGPVPTGNPPPPIPPPPPPPPIPDDCPAPGEVREWIYLIEPKVNMAKFEPDRPVVVEQDPDKQGFRLHITGTGGRYEHKKQQLERVCDDQPEPINGTPQPCREWHYECPIRCVECYNDPFAGIQVQMRLADSTMEWIQGELAQRYTGAQPKEGLPRTWQLAGVYGLMAVDQWWFYAPGKPDVLSNGPLDPGIHGGKIVGWTTGTPKSAPQRVAAPFSVPVFLMDTTIAK